jgi:hypothetical protein
MTDTEVGHPREDNTDEREASVLTFELVLADVAHDIAERFLGHVHPI